MLSVKNPWFSSYEVMTKSSGKVKSCKRPSFVKNLPKCNIVSTPHDSIQELMEVSAPACIRQLDEITLITISAESCNPDFHSYNWPDGNVHPPQDGMHEEQARVHYRSASIAWLRGVYDRFGGLLRRCTIIARSDQPLREQP